MIKQPNNPAELKQVLLTLHSAGELSHVIPEGQAGLAEIEVFLQAVRTKKVQSKKIREMGLAFISAIELRVSKDKK